jgi:hypothetical protein
MAGREELEQMQIPQPLELLADFLADVGVVGMEFC